MKTIRQLVDILSVAPTSQIFDCDEGKAVEIIAITTNLRDDIVTALEALLASPAKGIPQNDTHVVQDTSGQA